MLRRGSILADLREIPERERDSENTNNLAIARLVWAIRKTTTACRYVHSGI